MWFWFFLLIFFSYFFYVVVVYKSLVIYVVFVVFDSFYFNYIPNIILVICFAWFLQKTYKIMYDWYICFSFFLDIVVNFIKFWVFFCMSYSSNNLTYLISMFKYCIIHSSSSNLFVLLVPPVTECIELEIFRRLHLIPVFFFFFVLLILILPLVSYIMHSFFYFLDYIIDFVFIKNFLLNRFNFYKCLLVNIFDIIWKRYFFFADIKMFIVLNYVNASSKFHVTFFKIRS